MDRRVLRTIDRIKRALIGLIYEMDFNKITVRMICDRADIERKTFYLHYKDKYALMRSIFEDKLDEMKEKLKQKNPNPTPADFYYFLLDTYDKHRNFLKKIYNGRSEVSVRRKLHDYFLHRLEKRFGRDGDPTTMEFISAGVSGVLEAYVNGRLCNDKKQVAAGLAKLVEQAQTQLKA